MAAENNQKIIQIPAEQNANPKERKLRADVEEPAIRQGGNWFQRRVLPLLAGLAIAAGCGSIVQDEPDSDAEDVAQVDDGAGEDALDVQVDQPDVLDEGTEDVEQLEADADVDIPDLTDETEVIEEADADVPDLTDEMEIIEDAYVPETEGGGCVEVPLPDEIDRITGPEPFCGATQTTTTTTQVTERRGPECETTGRTSVMTSKAIALSSRLPTSGLVCARGTDMHSLNGDAIIVEQQPTRLEIARKIAKGVLHADESIGGTPGEYTVTLNSLRSDNAVFRVYDTAGTYQGNIYVYYATGYIVLPGFPSRAVIAYGPDMLWGTVGAAMIEVPTTIMDDGSIQVWTAGDRAEYTFNTNTVGSEFSGEGWTRFSP